MYQLIGFLLISSLTILGQNIVFPDPNFEAYCVAAFDTDGDGGVSEAEALAATNMYCSKRTIQDLTGIEFFLNLEVLLCSNNQLTSLPDLSGLTNLDTLWCYENQLTVSVY